MDASTHNQGFSDEEWKHSCENDMVANVDTLFL